LHFVNTKKGRKFCPFCILLLEVSIKKSPGCLAVSLPLEGKVSSLMTDEVYASSRTILARR
jgi:hypothetical protein